MDDAALRRAKGFTDAVLAWRHSYGADPVLVEAAVAASHALEADIRPVVQERRERPTDDLISGLWQVGPSVVPTWGGAGRHRQREAAVRGRCRDHVPAHLPGDGPAAGRPGAAGRVRDGGEPLRRVVDETLRHSTVVHWRARRATVDIELGGVTIRAGDRVHPVNAAANRDPARYADPDRFDAERAGYLGHLAFNVGPRHCVGAWLARMEAYESVLALLALPGLRLDPDAPAPEPSGFVSRTIRPLHVLFGDATP